MYYNTAIHLCSTVLACMRGISFLHHPNLACAWDVAYSVHVHKWMHDIEDRSDYGPVLQVYKVNSRPQEQSRAPLVQLCLHLWMQLDL